MPRGRPIRTKPEDEEIDKVVVAGGETPVEVVIEEDDDKGPEVVITDDKAPATIREPEDEKAVLKQRLAEIERAEEEAQKAAENARAAQQEALRERDEALRRADEVSQRADQSELGSVVSLIEAANSEAESAQKDHETALSIGDYKAAAEASRRVNRAEANISAYERDKAAITNRQERAKTEVKRTTQPSVSEFIDSMQGTTPEEKRWLRRHEDALTDQRKATKLQAAFYDAVDEGIERNSDEYFDFLETRLGYKKAESKKAEVEPEPEPQPRRGVQVAAPVSRQVPSASSGKMSQTRITLTKEEAEFAKSIGVKPEDYALNKQRLAQEKANGHRQ